MFPAKNLSNELFDGSYRKFSRYTEGLRETVTYPFRHTLGSLAYGAIGISLILELTGCTFTGDKPSPTSVIETTQTPASTTISASQPAYAPAITSSPVPVTPCSSDPDRVNIGYAQNGEDFLFYLSKSKTATTSDGYPRQVEEIVDVAGSYAVTAKFRDNTTRTQKGVLFCDNDPYELIIFRDDPTNNLMELNVTYASPTGKSLSGKLTVYGR